MSSSRRGFDYYYEKARGNGRSRDAAFEYAAHKYLDMLYDLQNFSEDKITREDLVLSMLIKYHKQRDRHNTHKQALSHVLKWVRDEVEHDIEKVSAANTRRRGHRNAFEGLEDLLDALPEDVLGSGWHTNDTDGRRMPPMPAGVGEYTMPPPIFDDMRAAQEAAGLGGRTYRAGERRPCGGVRDDSSYFTEERRPGGSGSSRHASYTFDERRPGRTGRDEYMPPRHTSFYTNEERRPGGSGREEYASSYSADDRRSRAHARSPSPSRRGPTHTSRPSYSSSSSSNHSYSSSCSYGQPRPTCTTNSHTHRPHHRPRSPSPAPDPYPNHIKPTTDLYRVINLPRSANTTEIKAVRRKLGLRYHPDKAKAQGLSEKEATEKMREINLACDVLGDEEGRNWYDRTGRLPAGR
ncbi:hypothetical protein FB567DRAFT_617569 [Paraphoma chrysanthemicola]|uniref:J domain-containing protein n=1 Tax=Paraphoma chrysanthemicola TaxID=798071 RepID=A0A8K0RC96_9PLEO|nr:hypothetical protein FB567DRAFT_617569 [Paraphoma chrysanthemicola]